MNLNHMNKPTVFDCLNCGQRIFKNNKQYHEDYQCNRKNGQKIKYKEKQPYQENLVKNPQNSPHLKEKKPQKSHENVQNQYKTYDSKKSTQIYSYQVTKMNRFEQPQLKKKDSLSVKGNQRGKKFCDQYEKRWGINSQIQQKEQDNRQKKENHNKKQIKSVEVKKQQEQKIEELKLECQECLQQIPVTQMEYHFSNCDRLEECQYCGSFVCMSSRKIHKINCQARKYWEEQNEKNPPQREQLRQYNNQDNQNRKHNSQYRQILDFEDFIHPQEPQFDSYQYQSYGVISRNNYQQNILYTNYKKSLRKQKEQNEYLKDCCLICYVGYEDGQKVAKLPCLHDYHPQCISQWLKLKNNCPICKTNL